MTDTLLALAVAAQRSGVSTRTLRRRLNDPASGLRAHRIGRRRLVSSAALETWLATCREPEPVVIAPDTLATFSDPARELIEWAICAANGHGATQPRDIAPTDTLIATQDRSRADG